MVKGVYDELNKLEPKDGFTIGIEDDVTFTSLPYDPSFDTENPKTVRCLFYGLGSDGTVGANKNSIKIIGQETNLYAQGYYSYDSKKSGGYTVSHLRFGPDPIYASYLINKANFLACHVYSFLEKLDVLKNAADGGTFLLNAPFGPEEIWDKLPYRYQKQIIDKHLKFYVIDAVKIAKETGMGSRTNTIMQTCFFAISGILPQDEAIKAIKDSIVKSYSRKGQAIVDKNIKAVDETLANLHEVKVPAEATSTFDIKPPVADDAPEFVKDVLGPVSALPDDGTFPTATTQYEKRNIAIDIPVWDPNLCIQCGKCVLVCPHAAIRSKVYDKKLLEDAPETFKHADAKWKNFPGGLCAHNCPVKGKEEGGARPLTMKTQMPLRETERANWNFFLDIPETDRNQLNTSTVKDVQLLRPLFEFSGACAGCGETPYLKLLSQLFGDRAIIANATGCSSIYGGNLPTTPWCVNDEGRGPAWSNSLFEDAAEFGLGFRLAIDKHAEYAAELLKKMEPELGEEAVKAILEAPQTTEAEIKAVEEKIDEVKAQLHYMGTEEAEELPRPRHRSLLQHRRTGLEVDPARSGSEIRRRGQEDGQERPRHDGHELRRRLRRQGCHRSQRRAHRQGIQGSRSLQRPVDNHRLLPLHSARHRHGKRPRPAETRGRIRPLDAHALQPGPLEDYIYNEVRYKSLKTMNKEEAALLLDEEKKAIKDRWRFYKHMAEMKMDD